MDLQEARKEIDALDREITRLFNDRMAVCAQIAEYKRQNGMPVYDPIREREKLVSVGEDAPEQMRAYVQSLYQKLFDLSRAYQKQLLAEPGIGQIAEKLSNISSRKKERGVALIGMPGCGKSTIGRALSQISGRALFDIDDAIERREGASIPEIFEMRGEAGFRKAETEALKEAAANEGAIIATGGGTVETPENYGILRNFTILALTRPLAALFALPTQGRPLSAKIGLEALYARRKPLYEAWSEKTYANEDILRTAESIRNDWL